MKLKAWQLKLGMNLYPPFLLGRVVTKRISPDFLEAKVIVRKSLLNLNLAGSVFGGTMFSAADPFYPIMYWQYFRNTGMDIETWLQKGEIDYLTPARSRLTYEFKLKPEQIEEARQELAANGRTRRPHVVEAFDKKGKLCARVKILVYLRDRNWQATAAK